MNPLSVFVTTLNNARTLDACLESAGWADEIVLLDSFSTDETLEIAARHGCRVLQHEFMGFGKQKQMALDATTHDWVLLLDADEALTPQLTREIQALLARGPANAGYAIARQEQLYWRMSSPRTRHTHILRLFDKRRGHFAGSSIHAAPRVDGRVGKLRSTFYHFGETDIHGRIRKVNDYTSRLVEDKLSGGRRVSPWILVFYPPFYFLRMYLGKRNFLNGWAGFMHSAHAAFYSYLKYAKVVEHIQHQRHGMSLLPEGSPRPRLEDPAE